MHDGANKQADCTVLTGSNLDHLPTFADCTIDSCVTDPPYELGFMGKAWDKSGIAYSVELWREVYRVLKPGAYLLAFGGSRTYHRMACAIEDAGFEIRDQIQWIYGSGFPKSLDVSKAIDKAAGAEREVVGAKIYAGGHIQNHSGIATGGSYSGYEHQGTTKETAPASADAKTWDGWGTALKPAHEPIVMARKPLEKGLTVAQNVLKWGTGAINIDGCRIETGEVLSFGSRELGDGVKYGKCVPTTEGVQNTSGRFPANVIHDGSDEVLEAFPEANHHGHGPKARGKGGISCDGHNGQSDLDEVNFLDSGSAARFFYSPKASKYDREAGLPEAGLPEAGRLTLGNYPDDPGKSGSPTARNHHPTVKPTDLMQYLCRLVTPPGGLILDPFLGSGSTMKAALIERFRCIGIELNPEYAEIARARLTQLQVKLF